MRFWVQWIWRNWFDLNFKTPAHLPVISACWKISVFLASPWIFPCKCLSSKTFVDQLDPTAHRKVWNDRILVFNLEVESCIHLDANPDFCDDRFKNYKYYWYSCRLIKLISFGKYEVKISVFFEMSEAKILEFEYHHIRKLRSFLKAILKKFWGIVKYIFLKADFKNLHPFGCRLYFVPTLDRIQSSWSNKECMSCISSKIPGQLVKYFWK